MAWHQPIPVPAEALATYHALRQMDADALRLYCDHTYAYWEPRGFSVYQYQALWLYADARLSCLTSRAENRPRLALTYQRQAGAQARTLNRWVCEEQEAS